MINFVHIRNTANTGDLASCPADYFPWPDAQVFNYNKKIPDGPLIVGGGTMNNWLQSATLPRGPKIAWGIGSSIRGARHVYQPPARFDLVGVRDYDEARPELWVPCVSCMSPLFDNPPEPTRPAVRFLNADPHIRQINPVGADDLPTMYNTEPMDEIVAFLASAEIVVTDSYHGAYWSALLGRTVVVVPYSSKFYHLPWALNVSTKRGDDWHQGRPLRAQNALALCREATTVFYARVCRLLGVQAAA